ncbi:juvenile hormone acid O-methyltransferase-like [Rhipicephalus sanguineus]|uniref:juvenile hormone acid O-methyltransferase-like n=1 Tax=Rhipicephalus sanguineus TaxID=34632 RepID=UPI0020C33C96|nr:juvenile hormone acid O-methyltransferase-like [Rhipicephalus sanguineus]
MGGSCDLDPEAFTWLKVYTYRDHLAALDSVQFRQPTNAECQHLDVGCGPGNFLSDCLLPRLRPFRRVVAIDVSPDMLQHARRHYPQRELSYEHHDIENGDPDSLLHKYGSFDRVFAFLTFHFVSDLKKGYHNVHRLLKDSGECLTVNFTRTGITDVWHRMYQKQEWRPYLPDLRAVFAERFCFDRPVPERELMEREKKAVTSAGLDLISCKTYRSQWVLPSVKACVDLYVPLFKLNAKVPKEKQSEFVDALQSTIYEASGTSAGRIVFNYDSIVTHSQKRQSSLACHSCRRLEYV